MPDLALDNVPPPAVVSVSRRWRAEPWPWASTTLTVNFSEPVVGGGTASNYQLSSVGPDGLLGTADDVADSRDRFLDGQYGDVDFCAAGGECLPLDDSRHARQCERRHSRRQWQRHGRQQLGHRFCRGFQRCLVGPRDDLSAPARGSDPLSVAVGDFNGDGKPDLAVANSGTNTVMVLLNNGNGTFTAGNSYSSGYVQLLLRRRPYGIVAGDFNGDGKLDLATANYDQTIDTGTVQIFLGNGNGTFTAGNTYTWSQLQSHQPCRGRFQRRRQA